MSVSDKVTMFYNAKPQLFEKARLLRDNMTYAEQKLWEYLRENKILGYRFKAQHPIDIFIADFYCHSLKLVIEVDGGIHESEEQKEYDIGREAELEKWCIQVIRFTNEEVENEIENVIEKIKKVSIDHKKGFQSPLQALCL